MTRDQALGIVIGRVLAATEDGELAGLVQQLVQDRIVFEDDVFDSSIGVAPWLRVVMRHQLRRQDSIGSRRQEVRGNVVGQLFTEISAALSAPAELSDRFARLFTGRRLPLQEVTVNESIIFTTPVIREGGTDGRWLITLVEAPFIYYDTVA